MPREHGMIFGAESIRAILANPPRKTQTRRPLTRTNTRVDGKRASRAEWAELDFSRAWLDGLPGKVQYLYVPDPTKDCAYRVRPVIDVGDMLRIRETWVCEPDPDPELAALGATRIRYKVDYPGDTDTAWRSPLFMPAWASRPQRLLVTDVRVQRVQDISDDDAEAEGVDAFGDEPTPYSAFAARWDALNAKRGYPWADNGWVLAYTFRAQRGEG